MKLSQNQILFYRKNGFLMLENIISKEEIDCINDEMATIFEEDSPRKILDKTGAVRTVFAPGTTSRIFSNLEKLDRLVIPAQQLLEGPVYAHQTKLNSKKAMVGDWWDWHQDFTYWHLEDGMPYPRALSAMVFLSNVTEFNGPLFVIPGSHVAPFEDSSLNEAAGVAAEGWYGKYQNSTSYMNTLTADLKYTIKQDDLAKWVNDSSLYSAKAPAGSVFFFHSALYHASCNNLSPWDRNMFLISYNSTQNSLSPVASPRPEFIAKRDFSPILPVKSII